MGIQRPKRVKEAQQKQLISQFNQGAILTASFEVPNQPGINQLISIQKMPDNRFRVRFKSFYPTQWDHIIEQSETFFEQGSAAWEWIKDKFKLDFSKFHLNSAGFKNL